jgi:predicted nucleic acid-binding protein
VKRVFVDANGWVALYNRRDRLYQVAINLHKRLLNSNRRYVTTNFVLDETYTALLTRVGHFAAVEFGEQIRKTKAAQIIQITEGTEEKAWQLFKRYSDKQFSFTDCTSFVVMRELNLTEAFTDDHHFEQMGFTMLLRR